MRERGDSSEFPRPRLIAGKGRDAPGTIDKSLLLGNLDRSLGLAKQAE
jgi:hypothetical protein